MMISPRWTRSCEALPLSSCCDAMFQNRRAQCWKHLRCSLLGFSKQFGVCRAGVYIFSCIAPRVSWTTLAHCAVWWGFIADLFTKEKRTQRSASYPLSQAEAEWQMEKKSNKITNRYLLQSPRWSGPKCGWQTDSSAGGPSSLMLLRQKAFHQDAAGLDWFPNPILVTAP